MFVLLVLWFLMSITMLDRIHREPDQIFHIKNKKQKVGFLM